MTNGEIIILTCTFISVLSAISAFVWWRLARRAQDATQKIFNKFCDQLEMSVQGTGDSHE